MDTMAPYGVIYVLINTVNDKLYVGQTVNFRKRMQGHKSCIGNSAITKAFRKYGWASFSCEILAHAQNSEELNCLEALWIAFLDTMNSSRGYNLTAGGHSSKRSPEVVERMRIISTGNKNCLGKKRPDTAERNKKVFGGKKSWNSGTRKPKVLKTREEKNFINCGIGFRAFVNTPDGKKFQGEISKVRWDKQKSLGIKTRHSADAKARRSEADKARYASPEGKERLRQMALKRWGKAETTCQ